MHHEAMPQFNHNLPMIMQEALNVLDRVAYVTPFADSPCLQYLSGGESSTLLKWG